MSFLPYLERELSSVRPKKYMRVATARYWFGSHFLICKIQKAANGYLTGTVHWASHGDEEGGVVPLIEGDAL
jgi:hypothetical protein